LPASLAGEIGAGFFFVFDIVFSATRRQFIRNRYNGIASVIDVRNNLHREMFCLT
jgi:hypothetical protein